jgi:hypothetical protein
MQFSRRRLLGAAIAATAGASSTGRALTAPENLLPRPYTAPARARNAAEPPLLAEARAALDRHSAYILARDRIALVDFDAHSRDPRLHLVDVASGRIERSWLCAHGNGSDPSATGMLQSFSNRPGSNATSRGAYVTTNTYHGKYGRSQRVIGLDPSNDQALNRAIVIHGAPYVDPSLIASQGRIGRSQGCFAVELAEIDGLLDRLGAGRLIFAGKVGTPSA